MLLSLSLLCACVALPFCLRGQEGNISDLSWEELTEAVDNYHTKRMYAASLPYALEMMNLAKERYHRKESVYGLVLTKTARASAAAGDWSLTQKIRQELVDVAATIYGKQSLTYASTLSHLADAEMQLGNYEQTEKLCWEVKNIKIKNPLNQRYYSIQDFNRSIDAIKDRDRQRNAYRIYLDVKIILVRSLITLASTYKAIGAQQAYDLTNEVALRETSKTVQYVLNSSGGVISDKIVTDMYSLFSVFEDFENYKKGEQLYLATMDLTRGTDLYLPLAYNLASIYVRIGEYTGAKLIYTKLLQNAEQIHGTESLAFSDALADLAAFYMLIEDSSEAAKLYLKAKGIVQRLEGRDSDRYQKLNKELKNVYKVTQQRDE
ncbi:tetratricopeptide repeat protein [Aureispira sp. CCB-E]|uniref:tetratricopeptide repeat protein n=1 Tax=Aureispira sp. CCB-E TaxID=3051121 RepID=UPI0028691EC2|nr:tetratricopeptide repeat protein [Aureispira sp. CCB-E]WMX15818.1 tetratricopeptide repeat protein [Aureispira sp. CCB-E]